MKQWRENVLSVCSCRKFRLSDGLQGTRIEQLRKAEKIVSFAAGEKADLVAGLKESQ